MYVLDTNSFIYFFKGLGNVAERLLATPPGEIALNQPKPSHTFTGSASYNIKLTVTNASGDGCGDEGGDGQASPPIRPS